MPGTPCKKESGAKVVAAHMVLLKNERRGAKKYKLYIPPANEILLLVVSSDHGQPRFSQYVAMVLPWIPPI